MMDHAKALADALRSLWVAWLRCDPGAEKNDVFGAAKALAAYDAHPAEAATRENGDPEHPSVKYRCTCGFKGLRHTPQCLAYPTTVEGGWGQGYPAGGEDDDSDIW